MTSKRIHIAIVIALVLFNVSLHGQVIPQVPMLKYKNKIKDSIPDLITQKTIATLNRQQNIFGSKLSELTNQINSLKNKNLIEIDSAGIQGGINYFEKFYPGDNISSGNSLGMSSQLKGIPLFINARYNKFPNYGNILSIGNGFKLNVSFDHKKFLEQQKTKLRSILDSADENIFLDSALIKYKQDVMRSTGLLEKQCTNYFRINIDWLTEYSTLLQGDTLNLNLVKNHLQSSGFQSHYKDLLVSYSSTLDTVKKSRIRSAIQFLDSAKILIDKAEDARKKINELKDYVGAIKKDVLQKLEKGGSGQEALNEILSSGGFQQLLMKLKDLQVGTILTDQNLLSGMPQLSMNGIRAKFNDKNNFGQLEMGKVLDQHSGLFNFNNALANGVNDTISRVDQKYFKLAYGIGSLEGQHAKFSLCAITSSQRDVNNSYLVSAGGKLNLLKNTNVQAEVSRNISVSSEEKNLGAIGKAIAKELIPESIKELAFSVRFEGTNDKNDLIWSAGYQTLPSTFRQFAGFTSGSGRSNYFISFKKTYFKDRLSFNIKYNKRYSFNGIYGNSNNETDYGRAQIRYRFKGGQFIMFHYSPNSSTYSASLKDTSLSQRMKGNAYGLSFFTKKRFDDVIINLNGTVETYKNDFIIMGVSTAGSEYKKMPFSTFGYQLNFDFNTNDGPDYFSRVSQLLPIDEVGQEMLGMTKQLRMEAGINLSLSNSLLAEFGFSLSKAGDFNPGGGLISNIQYHNEKYSVFLAINYDLIQTQRQPTVIGFGDRVELGYNLKLFSK